jgi:transcriptional regulator GlxA family with amidase domain
MARHTFALQPGAVTVSPAHDQSWYHLPEPGHHWCIHFRPARAAGATVNLPWHLPAGAHRAFVTDRMAGIARLHNRVNDPAAQAVAAVELQGLLLRLAMLAMQRERPPRRADGALEKLLRLLDERFAESWTVPQLAAAVGLTQDYLARCFRQRCGLTILRYLLQRRIEHARYLLTSTDLPVNRIATRVGLPDAQHFNKQFRRLVGMSPSHARAASGS